MHTLVEGLTRSCLTNSVWSKQSVKMFCTEDQLREIVHFAKNNPESRVKTLLKIRQEANSLLEQSDVDQEMLKMWNMGRSPSFAFSCNVVHKWEIYRDVTKTILKLN